MLPLFHLEVFPPPSSFSSLLMVPSGLRRHARSLFLGEKKRKKKRWIQALQATDSFFFLIVKPRQKCFDLAENFVVLFSLSLCQKKSPSRGLFFRMDEESKRERRRRRRRIIISHILKWFFCVGLCGTGEKKLFPGKRKCKPAEMSEPKKNYGSIPSWHPLVCLHQDTFALVFKLQVIEDCAKDLVQSFSPIGVVVCLWYGANQLLLLLCRFTTCMSHTWRRRRRRERGSLHDREQRKERREGGMPPKKKNTKEEWLCSRERGRWRKRRKEGRQLMDSHTF